MFRRTGLGLVVATAILTAASHADLIVTLEPKDSDGNPVTGDVAAGAQVVVDVLVSVDGEDNPLADLRLLQLDFGASSPALELDQFLWDLDSTVYGLRISTLPTPVAASLSPDSSLSLVSLDETPLKIATVEVTVTASGTLNAVGSLDEGQTSQAEFHAGSGSSSVFSLTAENLRGGTVDLLVAGSSPGDRDGDEVPDADDAFPDDPTESQDSDDDGIGDNADPDDDNDGVDDVDDAFPFDPTETTDTDGDGFGDSVDAFPNDPEESADNDVDGVGDNADPDDDNDGVDDAEDAFPFDRTEWADSDGDGIGDNAEQDTNTGPRVGGNLCGAAMPGAMLFILFGLVGTRLGRGSAAERVA